LLGLIPQLRLPSAVVEIVAGIVIGPSVLGWVKDDIAIHVIALMGLAVLLFLAGLEIDFARLRGPLLRITAGAFVLSLLFSLLVSFGLKAVGLIIDPPLIAIILASTSLGIVVPVLKDAGHGSSDFGQLVMGAASLAEVGPIVLLSLFFSGATPNIGAHVLVLAFLVILAAAVGFSMTRAARIAVLAADLRRLEDTTAQIRVRGAFLLVATMGAVAIQLGVEGILGTFMAGAILRLSKGGAAMTTPQMRAKLEAIGFGVFIPFFFVHSGLDFNLGVLLSSSAALLRVPVFLVALLVVRGVPALLYVGLLSQRRVLAAGLLQATSLSFILVAVDLGQQLHLMTALTGSALIATALLSSLLFPAVALTILGKEERGAVPAGVVSR
jgi:Kef-type K+ transport system membrane component KefB